MGSGAEYIRKGEVIKSRRVLYNEKSKDCCKVCMLLSPRFPLILPSVGFQRTFFFFPFFYSRVFLSFDNVIKVTKKHEDE